MADNAPSLSDPLGAPKIITGTEYMDALAHLGYNVENMSSPLPVMSKIAQGFTSLIDTQYDNALKWQKSQADTQETVARARNYDSVTNFNDASVDARVADVQSQSRYRDAAADQIRTNIPIDAQINQQKIKENELTLKERQRQVDDNDKAYSEYESWHGELSQIDPTDPDYDNKIASINAKYPEASSNPNTQRLISPLLQQQNVKRSQSSVVQQRTDQLNQLRGFQQNSLIPPDTDIQKEVAAGNGQSMVNRAKQQSSLNRMQTIIAYGNPSERLWAQNQINDITGVNRGPNETPPPMFGPNGDLNPGSEALLSTIERRIGISPVAPGAKKETKITTDETGTKTETTITGQPVTAQDITKPAQPTTTTAMPTKPEDMQKDPVFQSVFSDLNAGKLALPGNPKPGTPEFTAGLFAEYSKRKAAAAQPPAPQRASKAGRRGISEAQGQEEGRLATSNNDYKFPSGAPDIHGIDHNGWANVMSEEGAEPGLDPGTNHMSVFGLWQDKPGAEGNAYRVAIQNGPRSLEAYNAVTQTWAKWAADSKANPWELESPGMQELVLADVQHTGGSARVRQAIDSMGGFDAINKMDPGEAIRQYSKLRLSFWSGNAGRVQREGQWALANDGTLRGGSRVAKMQGGGLVTGAPGTDQVPAQLTRGEYVVNKDAVQDVGLQTLEALNAGTAGSQQLSLSSGSPQDVGLPLQQPSAPSQWPKLPTIAPQTSAPAPRATLVQTPAPRATLVQTPAVTTGPATLSATTPALGTVRTMSFGPPVDKPTHDVLYGALTDAKGNPVQLTTSDIAMSPNLQQKHGLKLGDYVDVLDQNGKVVYHHQRIADNSFISKGKPTTDSIELWGRPDMGYSQIRRSI